MCDVAPDVHPVPRWITETAGLCPQQAALRMNALRHVMGPGEYEALRRKERETKEREKAAQLAAEDKIFEERQHRDEAEAAEEFAARAMRL
jgi:hypothetical protein